MKLEFSKGLHRGPCITYREACDLAGVKSLARLLARDDAPKAALSTHGRLRAGRNSHYSKREMAAWVNKLKAEGTL